MDPLKIYLTKVFADELEIKEGLLVSDDGLEIAEVRFLVPVKVGE